MATRRHGKAYIYVTWLAKLLGGQQQCLWSAWFKAHFKYEKFEEQALDLVKWNRDHNRLMALRRRQLEADGWTVTTEEQNAFTLEGETALVAGKPDLIATKPGHVLVVDGKTGRERDSDIWQVLLYLFALPKSRAVAGALVGEVHYRTTDITVTPAELTSARLNDVVRLIKVIASGTAPPKTPSPDECKRCNIGIGDCPERMRANRRTVAVSEF